MSRTGDILDPNPSAADYILGFCLGIIGGLAFTISKVYGLSFLWAWYIIDVGGFTYQPPKLLIYGCVLIVSMFLMGMMSKSPKPEMSKRTAVYYDATKFFILSGVVWIGVGVGYGVYWLLHLQ